METEIMMVSSASRALSYVKKNPLAIDEEIFQFISDEIAKEGIRNEKIKRNMIASANIAIKLRRNTQKSEKQILKEIISEIPQIIEELD